jgi:poly(A) polymerase
MPAAADLRTEPRGSVAEALARQPFAAVLRRVGETAAREEIETYLVGGAVRDALLGRLTTDLDFVTVGEGTGIALAEGLADGLDEARAAHVYENFGTAAVRVPSPVDGEADMVLEFVAARSESYRSESRKPSVEAASLADDLRRRDFTVNALAAALAPGERFGALIDPFDGRADLERQRLRTPLDPADTFEDDPLRMIRAARFAAQLGFDVAEEAREAMQQHAERVEILSPERIADELQKIIAADVPSIGFKLLEEAGLLAHVLPELSALTGTERRRGERHKDNFLHTLQVLDQLVERVSDRPVDGGDDERGTRWLRWAALLHDIGKARTKRFQNGNWTFHGHEHEGARMVEDVFRRLKLPLDARLSYVETLVLMHHRPADLASDDVTDSAVRRLLFDAGEDLGDLMTLVRADVTSANPRRRARHQDAYDRVEEKMRAVEEKDRLRNFEPPLGGEEIMEALGIEEGVAVGIVKENVREAILDGEIENEHAAARRYMDEIADEALRRGALFEEMQRRLDGPEQQALGAIKEVLFFGEVPASSREAAIARLMDVKDEALADEAEERG